jgi:glycosyltransferase involved in cell wall biosynthesis
MNILILANHFNAGGISSYILNLAGGLVSRGHKVYVGSGGGGWLSRLKRYNLEHIYLPLRTKSIISPKLFFAYVVLGRILKEKKIDIIHSQTRVSSVLALWVSKKTSIPFVYTAHGFLNPRWGRRTFPCFGKLVIAISQPVREHLLRNFGLSEERIRLVHNGIDITRPQASGLRPQELKKEYGLKDGPVAGIIARLSEVKGHKYLLMAMKKVIAEIPDAQLLIVGEGSIKKDLQGLVQELGIIRNVYFIPAVSDTVEPLSVMDVFVMPSLEEGLGLSIMEAMLAGVPVAATDAGGITTLVKDNQTGILVKPADAYNLALAIIELLKNKEKARRLSGSARDLIVREFSLEKMAEETEKVYRECLK